MGRWVAVCLVLAGCSGGVEVVDVPVPVDVPGDAGVVFVEGDAGTVYVKEDAGVVYVEADAGPECKLVDVNAVKGMPQCPSDDGGFGVGCVELGSNDLCLVCPSGCLPENFYPPGGVEPDGGPLAAGVCTEALGEGAGVMWCVVPPDAGK